MVCSTRDEDFDPRKAEEVLPKDGRPGEVIKQLIAEGVCDSRTDHVNGRIGFSEQLVPPPAPHRGLASVALGCRPDLALLPPPSPRSQVRQVLGRRAPGILLH